MSEQVKNKALTSLARVKERLAISNEAADLVLTRLINSASQAIEGYLSHSLLRQTYTQELYSVSDPGTRLYLRNYPVTALTSLEYRAGTPSTPSWTAYQPDDYMLEDIGDRGVVYMYANLPKGPSIVRATYTAGYLIDFSDPSDTSVHTLPEDISEVCDQMVEAWYRNKGRYGTKTEGFNGGSITFMHEMTKGQKEILDKYKRLIF